MGIVENLMKIGFSEIESRVYLTLVRNEEMNGSRIAKELGLPRTSVYHALDRLYEAGAVSASEGSSKLYQAQDPARFIETMRQDFSDTFSDLKEEMSQYQNPSTGYRYWNFKGEPQFVSVGREWILNAEKEILINTDGSLDLFRDEIIAARRKGVRVIFFSVVESDISGLDIEYYYNPKWQIKYSGMKRFQMVCDFSKVLIAGFDDAGEFTGLYSENPLLVKIVTEHIHLDIYLTRLRKKTGKEPLGEELLIDSLMESWFRSNYAGE